MDLEVRHKDAGTRDSPAPIAAAAPASQSRVAGKLGPSDPKHLIYAGSKLKHIKAAPAAPDKNRRPPLSPPAPAVNRGRGSVRTPLGLKKCLPKVAVNPHYLKHHKHRCLHLMNLNRLVLSQIMTRCQFK